MKTARFLLITVALFAAALEAQTPTQDPFSQGLVLLQTEKYAEAQAQFETALNSDSQNPTILFNLGLSHYRAGHKGWAAACWRKALDINPDLAAAKKALHLVEKELPPPSSPEELGFVTQIQRKKKQQIRWSAFNLALLLVLIGSGALWLRFFGQRKKALEAEGEMPAVPTSAVLLSLLLLTVLSLMILKARGALQPRATVVVENASIRLSPDSGAPQISEVLQGQEVDLLQKHDDWIQVELSSGTSGWLPQKSLFQTTGQAQW